MKTYARMRVPRKEYLRTLRWVMCLDLGHMEAVGQLEALGLFPEDGQHSFHKAAVQRIGACSNECTVD